MSDPTLSDYSRAIEVLLTADRERADRVKDARSFGQEELRRADLEQRNTKDAWQSLQRQVDSLSGELVALRAVTGADDPSPVDGRPRAVQRSRTEVERALSSLRADIRQAKKDFEWSQRERVRAASEAAAEVIPSHPSPPERTETVARASRGIPRWVWLLISLIVIAISVLVIAVV